MTPLSRAHRRRLTHGAPGEPGSQQWATKLRSGMSKQRRVLLRDRDMRHVSWMLLTGLLACGNETRTPPFLTTIDTLNRVVHVVNSGDPPTWELRPMVTVGSAGEGTGRLNRSKSLAWMESTVVRSGDRGPGPGSSETWCRSPGSAIRL